MLPRHDAGYWPGGCLALEDAVTLIDALSDDVDVAIALAKYDRAPGSYSEGRPRFGALGTDCRVEEPHRGNRAQQDHQLDPPSLFLRASEETLGWRPPAEIRWTMMVLDPSR
jgi:hypothetical protein